MSLMKSLKYDLGYGYPPNICLKEEDIKQAIEHSLNKQETNKTFRYYNYGSGFGDIENIKAICNWYTKNLNCYYNPENCFLTPGCALGLLFSCMATLRPGDTVLIEGPTFFMSGVTMNDMGYKLVAFPREEDGQFNLEKLEETIIEHKIQGFYLVTNYNNPMGLNLKLKDRLKIYELANKYNFYVFSDDIYEFLYLDESSRTLPLFFCDEKVGKGDKSHLSTFDNDNSKWIISLNSFNKLISPSFRLGFIQAHSSVIAKIGKLGSIIAGGGLKNVTEHFAKSYIELGILDKNTELQRKVLKEKVEIADEILKKCQYLEYVKPEGGYFIFVKISEKVSLEQVHSKRVDYNLNYVPGECFIASQFLSEYSHLKSFIRLSISFQENDMLAESLNAFIKLLESCLIEK